MNAEKRTDKPSMDGLVKEAHETPNLFLSIPSLLAFEREAEKDAETYVPHAGLEVLAHLIVSEIIQKAEPDISNIVQLANGLEWYTNQYAFIWDQRKALNQQTTLNRQPPAQGSETESGHECKTSEILYHRVRELMFENSLIQLACVTLEPKITNPMRIEDIVRNYARIRQAALSPALCQKHDGQNPACPPAHRLNTLFWKDITGEPDGVYFADEVVYSAARDFILDGIRTSSQKHSDGSASNGYRNWFRKRLKLLAPLSKQTGYDKEDSKKIARHAHEEYSRLVEEVAPRLLQRFQQLNAAFAKAKTAEDTLFAHEWLMYAVNTYSRVLGVDKKEVKKEAEKKIGYLIAREEILYAIEDSFDKQQVGERASNRYIGWLEKRLGKLAPLSKKTGYDGENSEQLAAYIRNQNIQAIRECKVRITNQQGVVSEELPFTQFLHRQFQQLANIFMGAETPDDAMRAYMPLVDLVYRHSIVLGIDQEKFGTKTKKKLAFLGLEVKIASSPQPNADERGYESATIQTGTDEQTGIDKQTGTDEQTSTDNAPNSSNKQYSRNKTNNGSKKRNSFTEKVITALAGIGAAAALGWGAYQWHKRPEPPRTPTIAEQIETLPRTNGMPGAAEEAVYVHAFHHGQHRAEYLAMRRGGWHPAWYEIRKLAHPFEGEEQEKGYSWEEVHSARRTLLDIYRMNRMMQEQ